MPKALQHFAILAPVPLEHLISGEEIAKSMGFVALGTRKWELLRKIDEMREGLPIPVLIYQSHEDDLVSLNLTVTWFGWYFEHKDSKNGAHPEGMKYRPKSTEKYELDNKGYWAAFWHVRDLRRLPAEKQIAIGKIKGIKGGWRKDAPPRGPELVELPELLSYEK